VMVLSDTVTECGYFNAKSKNVSRSFIQKDFSWHRHTFSLYIVNSKGQNQVITFF